VNQVQKFKLTLLVAQNAVGDDEAVSQRQVVGDGSDEFANLLCEALEVVDQENVSLSEIAHAEILPSVLDQLSQGPLQSAEVCRLFQRGKGDLAVAVYDHQSGHGILKEKVLVLDQFANQRGLA
jgi:hypothetical protein